MGLTCNTCCTLCSLHSGPLPLPPQRHVSPAVNLLLQLQQAVKQCLGSGGTSRDVDVHGYDAVAATDHGVRVVVVTAAISAAAHGDHPPGLWHLVVHPEWDKSMEMESP